ncbi:MAG: aldehyde ferredoxin oxidoreductase family protein [Anaerolineae bacterium]|nr:aldehyde ferredoxin oxidoreductase family protein [Anaerolineae bacterium]
MKSYFNRYLRIDLGSQSWSVFSLPQNVLDRYVGGKGVAAYLLAQYQDPKAEPFAPDNPLIFATGPLTGTRAPSMRSVMVFQSPVTRLFTDSHFGGFWGQEIKAAGYDGLLITGQADAPAYVEIDDDRVAIKDASGLWGLDTYETYDRLRPDYPEKEWRIACIGPAGENRVKIALIDCDYHRQAGRGGGGAVMGAKKLKAIVVRGTHKPAIHDADGFQKLVQATIAGEMKENDYVKGFRAGGTAASIPWADVEGLLPTRNFQRGSFAQAEALGDAAQQECYWYKDVACAACPIACTKLGRLKEGRYAGLEGDSLEYESAAMLGANLEIGQTDEAVYLGVLCDKLGLDTISAGSVLGFACEAVEKGLLDADVRFGDVERLAATLHDIAARRGAGELLAEGVRAAAAQIGGEAEHFAIHVKGLELPAWGPRGVPGMGLAYMTADRGGCHQRAFPILYEAGGEAWRGQTYERLGLEGKAQLLAEVQNRLAGLDTLITCDFARYAVTDATYLELLAAATGRRLTLDELYAMGARIWNLTRLFNLKAGMSKADEDLPGRFKTEPLPDGPAAGHLFTDADIERLLGDYYAARGWDENGVPLGETLGALGVEYPRG